MSWAITSPALGTARSKVLEFARKRPNLANDTTYYYSVEAEDDNGTTVETDPQSFTTRLAGDPSGYFLTDDNNPVVERTATSLSVTVHVATRGEAATSAQVYLDVSTTSNFAEVVKSVNKAVNADNSNISLAVSGLEPETTYYLRRRIVNNANITDTSIIGPFTTQALGVMFLIY